MEGKAHALELEIFDLIAREGPIPFARFMAMALYHPRLGYYTSGGERIGKGGDYLTSSDISPIFGRMLARQLAEMDDLLQSPKTFTVTELGAGKGALACQILKSLREYHPDLYSRTRYIILEKSPVMLELQHEMLDEERDIVWAGSHEDPILKGAVGCVLSNEFFDALPVHIVELAGEGGIREIYVDRDEDGFKEAREDPSTPDLIGYLHRQGIDLAPGQRAEICLEALKWIKRIADFLSRGFVITIDYGYPAEELYAPHRPRGTLLAYHRHSASEDIFADVGKQDLTAHVNFTALAIWGRDYGLDLTGFTDQLGFFLGLGIDEVLEEMDSSDRLAHISMVQSAKELFMPGGMGEVFKVLIQHRGIPSPRLKGLLMKPFKRWKINLP